MKLDVDYVNIFVKREGDFLKEFFCYLSLKLR